MTHDEQDDFLNDIAVVAARTEAVVFATEDDQGVQYALYPRRKMPLERAVISPLRRRRRRPRGLPSVS